jgi:hypothetical protein
MVTTGLGHPMQSDSSSAARSANQPWRHPGSASPPSVVNNSAMNTAQLVIKHVLEQHAGWYRCVTDHSFGHYESYGYYLNVRGMPKIRTDFMNKSIAIKLTLDPC